MDSFLSCSSIFARSPAPTTTTFSGWMYFVDEQVTHGVRGLLAGFETAREGLRKGSLGEFEFLAGGRAAADPLHLLEHFLDGGPG